MNEYDEKYPLEWIDGYIAAIRDYVTVRETDNLLIKVPNEAHKLNESGVAMMSRLFGGESIMKIWDETGRDAAARRDMYEFFIGLKQLLNGCMDEFNPPASIVKKPFDLNFSDLPILSEIALSYRCNLSCVFCYAGCACGKNDPTYREQLSTDDAKRILDIIRLDAQVPSVSFTGGEPTLRDDLEELIKYARHDLGMRVNLITNGTLVDARRAVSLKDAGLNSAQVSLEAPDEELHDRLTRVRGSFARTVAAVKHIKETGLTVHTNTTVNRMNMGSAADMPEFVASLGLERFSMNMVIPVGSSVTGGGDVNVFYREMPEILRDVIDRADRCGVEFMWYSPTPICIFNPIQYNLGNKGCAACDGLLSVSPAGDVLPCSSWSEPVGNLLKDGFSKVWNSAWAKSLRNKDFAADMCKGCEDFALCQGACPLYRRYFGDDELKEYGVKYVAASG